VIVLVPQAMVTALPYANDKQALKIASLIVCRQIGKCAEERAKKWLKGKPDPPKKIFAWYRNVTGEEFKKIASGYRKVVMRLESDKVIQRNGKYSNHKVNPFSMSYRLHPLLWEQPLNLWNVTQRASKRKFHRTVGNDGGHLNEHYRAGEQHLQSFVLTDADVPRINALCDLAKWPDQARHAVARYFTRSWWSKVDGYGRYHSPLTLLSKAVRGELKCQGESVVGFDYANFQPCLLPHQNVVEVPSPERKRYEELCGEARIYDFMLEQSQHHETRAEIKDDYLKMLNRKNENMVKMPLFHVFRDSFPNYARALKVIKQHDHREMARFLQRLEAKVMFDEVVKQFRANTEAPFFTVHDAIYTEPRNKHLLQKIMTETASKLFLHTQVKQETPTQIPINKQTIYDGMNLPSGVYCLNG